MRLTLRLGVFPRDNGSRRRGLSGSVSLDATLDGSEFQFEVRMGRRSGGAIWGVLINARVVRVRFGIFNNCKFGGRAKAGGNEVLECYTDGK